MNIQSNAIWSWIYLINRINRGILHELVTKYQITASGLLLTLIVESSEKEGTILFFPIQIHGFS